MQSERQLVITVFGITGDWAYKKVIPSLWYLWKNKKIDENFSVIGFGRRPLSLLQLNQVVMAAVKDYLESTNLPINSKKILEFSSKFSYVQNDFKKLKDLLPEKSHKIFYCATPPNALNNIFTGLKKVDLCKETSKYWTRVVVEKPFGENEKSAKKLILSLKKNFKSSQVFPIDHYLFKESVQKIRKLDSTELNDVSAVDITTDEFDGVEKRGKFYDSVGALRDVGQNHLLMLVAVLFSKILKNRLLVLRGLRKWNRTSLQKDTYRAQHVGYTNIKDVDANSRTETFFVVRTQLHASKGVNVPICLQSGKKLSRTNKIVIIKYKNKKKNKTIQLKSKVKYVEEYTKALHDVVKGNKEYFVTYEEILACWKFTDPIIHFWKKNGIPLDTYEPGTTPQAKI